MPGCRRMRQQPPRCQACEHVYASTSTAPPAFMCWLHGWPIGLGHPLGSLAVWLSTAVQPLLNLTRTP